MKNYLLAIILLSPLLSLAQNQEKTAIYAEMERALATCDSLLDMGIFEEAMNLAKATEQKVLESVGKNTPLYADCLYTLGRIGSESGDYPAAEQYLTEAVSLRKDLLGTEHEEYIQALLILGSTYTDMGSFDKAEPTLQNAVDIAHKALGTTHRSYIRGRIFQGILYEGLGQYEKAERILLEALSIVEEQYAKTDRFYTIIQNNLGVLYAQAGRYMECEQHLLISNALVKEQYGENHIQFAGNLFNLGFLYDNTGRYAKAEECYLLSKSIVENNMGRENFYYAGVANNLGLLYYHTGQLDEAEQYFQEAIGIRTKLIGGPHASTATSINNLALVYEKMNRHEDALEQHLRALSMREELLGKAHPHYAQSLSNLGNLALKTGQYAKAESLYLEANRTWEAALGREHPDIAINLISLGLCFSKTARPAEAEAALREASGIQRRLMEKATRYLSESELATYTFTFHNYQNILFSITDVEAATRPGLAALCYDNSLFYKGFLLQEAQRMRKLVNADSAAQRQFELLSSLHRQLASQYAKPISERQGTAELESQINELERTLAHTTAGFRDVVRQASWQEARQELPADGAAVEFIRYRQNYGQLSDSMFYAALVLRPGQPLPQWIPLCEEKQLDALLQWGSSPRQDDINNLYVPGWGGNPIAEKTLYHLLWAPLEAALDGAQTLYFSPDGLLHRLNLGAIPDEQGRMLGERFQLVRLNSTRQLVIPAPPKKERTNALLFGGIRYNLDSTALAQSISELPPMESVASRGELRFENADTTLRAADWAYLPGTAQEVAALKSILYDNGIACETRTEYTATEEAFKLIGQDQRAPEILHLATHGYFFPDPSLLSSSSGGEGSQGEAVFKISEHPLIRSGLILAGGNHTWKGNPPLEGYEDGILTAYEISRMNLAGTELVVLSACETGLGDIVANEGVYGLQRAFRIAGARYLLLSLWKVPDRQTTQLMELFYKKWLEQGLPLRDALSSAQLQMREEGWPPFYWAGFVLME
ncbi:MAG: CHAT domain-containing protein [Lewinellaceae bacterium]|nr:CHAT domain-containing protein [Lewinellaceae bacterium]